MKTIKNGIVFSNDIERILKGLNALDFQYEKMPSQKTIDDVRSDFEKQVNRFFNSVSIVSEEEMVQVNNLIGGEYPHRIVG